ncbi:hypothetical protein M434DRAFT_35528 [Hypoxylon sp. CO27-5]|nr:hypothetical protein M434DRAFT_35528 [Hypoxylon sp. CO27-5]
MDISDIIAAAKLLAMVAVPVVATVIAIGTSVPRFSAQSIPKEPREDCVLSLAKVLGIIATIGEIIHEDAFGLDILAQAFFILTSSLSKVELCLSIRPLFYKIREWKLPLEILLLFLLVTTPAYSFIALAQCPAIGKNPLLGSTALECWNRGFPRTIGYIQEALDIILPLLITLFPIVTMKSSSIPGCVKPPIYIFTFYTLMIEVLAVLRIYEHSRRGCGADSIAGSLESTSGFGAR